MSQTKRKRAGLLAVPMYLWALLFVGLPLIYVLGLSFSVREGDLGVRLAFTLDNYARLLDPMYVRVFADSFALAFVSTLLCFVIGYPFGYFLARVRPRWRAILLTLVIVPFWTNALIRIYGWKILLIANGPINEILKWLGLIERPLKMLNTQGAVLLGMVYALIPFMILPTYTSVEKMDWSVVEAARDLGASRFHAFCTVTLPLTMPGILAGCVLVFVPATGLFFLSDLLGGGKYALVGNTVRDELLKAHDSPLAAAISVVLLAFTGVILWVYRRAGGSSDLQMF